VKLTPTRNLYQLLITYGGRESLSSSARPRPGLSRKSIAKRRGITDPFIVENGGAIFIKQGYFSFKFDFHRLQNGYQII